MAYGKAVGVDRGSIYWDEAAEKRLVTCAATMFKGQLRAAAWDSSTGWVPSRSTAGQACAAFGNWETAL